jgi:hypothetical protein
MSDVVLRNIREARFRANPEYQLIVFDRLPPDQQNALRDLTKDPDLYGVLMPREGSAGNTKSVCRETALLLFTLGQPGPLPGYVPATLGDSCNQAIAELVLDGVLQIESGGRFVCGSEAYDLIYVERQASQARGPLPQLTQAALEYAQALDIDDGAKLSARLYFYNRVPLSPSWKRRFPGAGAVEGYLGIDSGSATRRLLEGRWTRMKLSPPSDGWFQWESREDPLPEREGQLGYKLYVSPQPNFVRDAFQAVVKTVMDHPAHHFKIGKDAAGLLRPDKIVVYFWDFEALLDTAMQIAAHLAGCPAQGVPFTAGIGEDALLSWGVDPPPETGVLAWQERTSWRLWITNRIATALLAAKSAARSAEKTAASSGSAIQPWWFAVERLRLENVNTDTWTPLPAFGRQAAGAE